MDFDPNNPMKEKKNPNYSYDWATYVPYRSPEFKVHGNRGHALNAVINHYRSILYRKEGDRWVEVYRVEDKKSLPKCPHDSKYPQKKWFGKDTDSPYLLLVCTDCYNERVPATPTWGDSE